MEISFLVKLGNYSCLLINLFLHKCKKTKAKGLLQAAIIMHVSNKTAATLAAL